MNRFEIIVEINNLRYSLDTFQDDFIEVVYNIADIMDISSRNSSYTKTINIPETSLNRQIFGDISDLSVDSTFNPNLKTKCWVFVDSVLVLEGFIQLRNVIDDIDLQKKTYEIVIFAENDNFIKEIGELELTDLDFSELSHTYSAINIETSWTQSWNWGYYYPIIDYGYDWDYNDISGNKLGRNDVEVEDMFPATNVKYILDKIFRDAGYSYQSDFLNSNVFKDLYIPFNSDFLKRDVSSLNDKFSVGMTGPVTFDRQNNLTMAGGLGPYAEYNNEDFDSNGIALPQFVLGTYRVPFNNESSPYGDPDGLYDNINYEYVATGNEISQRFVCNFDISFLYRRLEDWSRVNNLTGIPSTNICFKRSKDPVTGVDVVGGVVIPIDGSTTPLAFTSEDINGLEITGPDNAVGITASRVIGQISTDVLNNSTTQTTKLYPNEKVWVEVKYSIFAQYMTQIIVFNPSLSCITFNNKNEFFNNLSDRVYQDELIDYTFTCIPKNIKQRDFFTSLIKMFNLYVEPSKEYDRTLVIEPRDEYYEGGGLVDWSLKLDIGEPLNIKILGETQNRKTIFTYKQDSDYYNTDYKDFKAGEIYGEYDYEIDNDFVVGEKKVELIFSPTPLVQVPNSNKLVIPKIGKINNNLFSPTNHNIRILTKFRSSTSSDWNYTSYSQYSSTTTWNGYLKLTGSTAHNYRVGDCVRLSMSDVYNIKPIFKVVEVVDNLNIVLNILYSDVSGLSGTGVVYTFEGLLPTDSGLELFAFNLKRYRAYPYLGHFDNPFEPRYDLNFGQTVGLYYPETSVTNDNLFSVYWENYMIEISDKNSRIISGSFYLTPDDIATFKFNNKVFINNQYYKVNKINYNPDGLSQVELIKSLVVTIPRQFSITSSSSIPTNDVVNNDSLPPIKVPAPVLIATGGPRNTIRKNKNLIVGTDNASYGQNVYLLGNSNVVSSNNNFVVGDDNKIDRGSEGNVIFGSNNEIKSGVDNTFVFGSDLTITESDTFYIQGKLVNAPNYISAGRNEVLSPFSDTEINYISAGRDAVRELGSYTNINIINCGRFIL